MSKSVGSEDLRKMMQKVRATKVGTVSAKFKEYKLSNREQQLIEEQKQRERLASEAEQAELRRKRAAPSQVNHSKPGQVKNILKKTNYVPPVLPTSSVPKAISSSSSTALTSTESISQAPKKPSPATSSSNSRGKAPPSSKPDDAADESESKGDLPEGFFDDPQQDAKVSSNGSCSHIHIFFQN